jgi:transcriptional regulator with XRE-family HTH domain
MKYSILKELLTQKRINIPTLAKEIGMSKPGLYLAIEKERLTVETLEKIAGVLEVPVNVFFGEESIEADEAFYDQIKNLKQRIYIMDSIARDMRRFLSAKMALDSKMLEKSIPETPEEKLEREDELEELLAAAVDTMIYFDQRPDILAAYREKLSKNNR